MTSVFGSSRHLLVITLLTFLLTACGGGGGGSSSGSAAPTPQAQAELSAAQNPLQLVMFQEPYSLEVSGGSGSGALSYSSSDTAVITVDDAGTITPVAVGSAEVLVEKAADSQYRSAETRVAVEVVRAPQEALVFGDDETSVYIDAEPFTNPLNGGSGTGEVTYSSSDASVITVDAQTGLITVAGEGSAEVLAHKAADEQYLEAQTSFRVQIEKYLQQPLSFEQSLLEAAVTTNAPENPLSGGSGSGELVFTSSAPEVAEVNAATGSVSAISAGTAVITAAKAGDALYQSAQASYELEAFDVVGGLSMDLSATDTAIHWEIQRGTIEVIRSTYFRCDADNYRSCRDGRLNAFYQAPSTPHIDTLAQLDTLAYVQLQNEDYRSSTVRVEPSATPFAALKGVALIAFSDKLWAFGGVMDQYNIGDYRDQAWSSVDGVNWTLEKDGLAFGPRAFHKMTVFKDHLYLFAGEQAHSSGGIQLRSDIWRSANGTDWELIEEYSPIGNEGKVVIFQDQLWAVQSTAFGNYAPEVWSSADGEQWTKQVAIAPFGKRSGYALYTDGERLFLAGGYGEGGSDNRLFDIWVSADGIEWNQEVEQAAFGQLWDGVVTQVDDIFYLFLGDGQNSYLDRYYYRSSDGLQWEEVALTPLTRGGPPSIARYKDQLWLLPSGSNNAVNNPASSFIWRSKDAVSWRTPVDLSGLLWERRQ
ncbi:hypothetical protein [Gilvimarinus algae]|uniref:DUF6242 domain-containing protein n=1 Tax=Gilvimarinus algae TaxID=3058037 RepID=A0ABT8TEA6_9GAMM|nr:hypothetical protein [Gilvimarinus sp. SDUM040014]MDO3382439.1 hypothetical protein [Gilvimarinus sp. SDUM040014]